MAYRARQSPYKMITVEDAVSIVLKETPMLETEILKYSGEAFLYFCFVLCSFFVVAVTDENKLYLCIRIVGRK